MSRQPCKTCPFRRDAPHGIWAPSHYLKIAYVGSMDDQFVMMGCHQHGRDHPDDRRSTPCWGWVKAAPDSPGVQVHLRMGNVAVEDLERGEETLTPLGMMLANGFRVSLLPGLTYLELPRECWHSRSADIAEIQRMTDEEILEVYVADDSPLRRPRSPEEINAILGFTPIVTEEEDRP